jgi:hypothetical protein
MLPAYGRPFRITSLFVFFVMAVVLIKLARRLPSNLNGWPKVKKKRTVKAVRKY